MQGSRKHKCETNDNIVNDILLDFSMTYETVINKSLLHNIQDYGLG